MPDLKLGDLRHLAAVVADSVHLHDVRLANLSCKGTNPLLAGPFDVTTELQVAGSVNKDGVQVSARYRVSSLSEADPERSEAWHVRLRFDAEFQWDAGADEDSPSFSKEETRAFGLLVGLTTIHPYARETVQSLSGRLGYPPFSLELMESLVVASDDSIFRLETPDADES